jgi:hypothetical protein
VLGIDHERLTYRYAGRDFRLIALPAITFSLTASSLLSYSK